MTFRKFLAEILLSVLLVQNLGFLSSGEVFAAPDPDGSANIDLYLTPTLPASTIIGENFSLGIALQNQGTSDGDAYKPGFILSLPTGINFVSAGSLGAPTRTVNHASGVTLLFFQTSNEVIIKGLTSNYTINLSATNAAGVFTNRSIGVLGYVNDNIYGRGPAPSGSPPATLTGGVDYAAGSGVSMPDTTNLTFPTNVGSGTNLSTLPFITSSIQFTPYDVTKEESTSNLIGDAITTTLTVEGNSMGPLKHFHLQDIIPSNRAFVGFLTSTGANIGGLTVTYDMPSPGLATIDITDITVPTGMDTIIQYQTLPLAYDILSYSGSTPILDTGSVIPHADISTNTVIMHTGGLALSGAGGPFSGTTWNNGISDITVGAVGLLGPRSINSYNRFANLAKGANMSTAVIGDVVTYTLTLDTSHNAAFTTNGSGTYITDILPDGMFFSGAISSTLSGAGTPFTFIGTNTSGDGDTTITWRLNSGNIGADTRASITYQAVVDGAYEGAGDTEYENTEILVNTASFFGTVGDGGLSGDWGITDPSLIDTTVSIDNITATLRAPTPTTKKHLISVTTPGGTVYDHTTGLPSTIPPGSTLRFAVTMDFPNVNFINPKLIDALPLLAGPNESTYDIAFQMNPSLTDIYNSGVLFNTDDGVTPSASFNGLTLSGTAIPNSVWIVTNPANNLEFHLNSGVGRKTFAILFSVDVLPTEPSGGVGGNGLVPLTNFAYSSFNDDSAVPNPLPIMDIPFTVNFPSVTATKVASGGTNAQAERNIDYTITLTNSGSGPAFLENVIDTLPLGLDFLTGTIVYSGSSVELPNTLFTQSGNILSIAFDTGSLGSDRNYIPTDNTGTPSIRENIVVIRYTVKPNSTFVIQGGATRTNTVTLDYYASTGALSNEVNNLGPVTTSANITVTGASLVRSIVSTSEPDSPTSDLYVGEEVVYRTVILIPQGTLTNASYAETKHADLTFISGAIIASSGGLSYTGGSFSGATVVFGNIINTDTDLGVLETIVIETTYRVQKSATAGTNRQNVGTFTYSSTSTAGTLNVNVRKPTITLTKSASPTTGDAEDVILYTVTVNNTSTTANAYDIRITDLLPTHVNYVTGSLVLGTFSGSDVDLFSASGGGNGLAIDRISTLSGASFTFQGILSTGLRPADIITNRADVIYDTLDDDGSLFEWSGSTSATAVVTVPDIVLTHSVYSTDLADTTSALFSGTLTDLAIGERVIYRTIVSFPETIATGVTFTQTLPVGMKFLSGVIAFDGVKSHTLSSITVSPDNVITFTLGDIDNTCIGAGTGLILLTEASVLDHGANTVGSMKTSTLLANYSEKSKSINTALEIVEPTLLIVKDYSPNTGDAGDVIPTSLTITNTSLVHAYDVVITDVTPSKLTPDGGYSGTIVVGTLNPGESRNYTYNSTINTNISPGENITGTASVISTSYPGSPTEGERSYTVSDTDTIVIVTPGSIAVDLLTTQDVTIGDVSEYRIRVPVGEATTNLLDITSTLPTGMVIVPGSVSIVPDASITYSGVITPIITPDSDIIGAGFTQSVTYNFTDVVNSNSDNGTTEYITLFYNAVVMNSSDTNNGNTKSHSATALYDGVDTKSGASLPVTIREPSVQLAVSNGYANGYSVPYTFVLTNNGSSTAYDVNLSTLLPTGVSYTGVISITNSGGAVNLTQVGDSFTLDSLPVNTGNPLIFSINGSVSESVPNYTLLVLTGTVVYTSEPGSYTPSLANPLNTERTSLGGVDDYIDANKTTSFALNIALLDETIGVVDINGGVGLIEDIFEYTITLINTGSVPLSGIPVTLDIPTGFTGFTIISIPPGATDLSTETGGTNGAGYLSMSGISIPNGQSRTIIYRVTALLSVIPGTTIPTAATVGNSLEGAIGGSPSVPVMIEAPRLISTAIEVDTNGGTKLLPNESIRHTLSLSNSGTASGANISVILTWQTGSTYTTGSIVFQTGTFVDTGSLFIDEIARTLSFTIPILPVGVQEVFVFDTTATGPVGSTIQATIRASGDLGITTDTPSNILMIESPVVPVGPGGGGGGSPTPGPTPPHAPSTPPTIETPKKIPPTVKPPKVIPKKLTPKTPVLPIMSEYENYLKMKNRLGVLLEEESRAGVKSITSPKVLPQTGKSILSRVKRLVNSKLSLEAPEFQKGDTTLESYLVNLPKEDRNRDEYIVLPSNGMITPINTVPENIPDYKRLVSGREIDVNKYLKTGVMTYPGTNNAGLGGVGNTVIFGHSSYFKGDSGRYKTHFQKIIELEEGEEIWIFKKDESGNYKKYRYVTEKSYDVKATEVSILDPGIGKNLTLFTCTPIGGITGRWVVKAKYIDEEKIMLEERLYGLLLTSKQKKSIQKSVQEGKNLSQEERRADLEKKYSSLDLEPSTEYVQYFRMQIAKEYAELSNISTTKK